jgi:hypothetical protein
MSSKDACVLFGQGFSDMIWDDVNSIIPDANSYIWHVNMLSTHMRFIELAVCSLVAFCCIQSGVCAQITNASEVYHRLEMIDFEVQQAFRKISNLAKSSSSIITHLEGELQGYVLRAI